MRPLSFERGTATRPVALAATVWATAAIAGVPPAAGRPAQPGQGIVVLDAAGTRRVIRPGGDIAAGPPRLVLGVATTSAIVPPRDRPPDLLGTGGAEVERVEPETAASRAGIEPGDLILSLGGRRVTGPGSLAEAVQASAGRPIAVELLRRGGRLTLLASPSPKPPGATAEGTGWVDRLLPFIDAADLHPGAPRASRRDDPTGRRRREEGRP